MQPISSLLLDASLLDQERLPDLDAAARDGIRAAVTLYLTGGRDGQSAVMRPAFAEHATITGYFQRHLMASPIQAMYDWVDENPAPTLTARVVSVQCDGTAAQVRLAIRDWAGVDFTDMFQLVRIDGEWKIVSKVFQAHPIEDHLPQAGG